MKRARFQLGSVVFNKRSGTWHFLWREHGTRRSKLIGTLREYPTKALAWKAAEPLRRTLGPSPLSQSLSSSTPTVRALVERYEQERLPSRSCTARVYRCWLNKYVLPQWGDKPITDIRPHPTELWLCQLNLSPKSKAHVRYMLRTLIDFAMYLGVMEISRNPMELVRVKGATKRVRKPRSLTVQEFQKLIGRLKEPFRTMALVCVCLGLRVSECLGLKWKDVDWLNGQLSIERSIVEQKTDDVKTETSRKSLSVDQELLQVLSLWKQATQFPADKDWVFASPLKLGRLPYSYTGYWRELNRAGSDAGIGHIGTHSLRHTFRSWLDAVGTPIAVQQRLMRHADIRTTMNVYGDVVTDEMGLAHSKVVGLALSKSV